MQVDNWQDAVEFIDSTVNGFIKAPSPKESGSGPDDDENKVDK